MKKLAALLLVTALLSGCGDWLEPPEMKKPVGVQTPIPPQDTPAKDARAQKERDDLPAVPQAPDPATYSNLGTVPPRPSLPTPAQIAGQVRELAIEQNNGAAVIAQQENAPDIETLPKPAAKASAGIPPGPVTASDDQVSSGYHNAFVPQSQQEDTDRLPADAP